MKALLLDFLSDVLAGLMIYSSVWVMVFLVALLTTGQHITYGLFLIPFTVMWGLFCIRLNLKNRYLMRKLLDSEDKLK